MKKTDTKKTVGDSWRTLNWCGGEHHKKAVGAVNVKLFPKSSAAFL